ncbi:LuxR C-terminal-related transcriptional regulator [Niabella sp. CJ426]|uniref:LuxR C-terminal-related transcriptional regulator n=1 Tax=Niabella sp. CJ426 TaxID=3393740 RepID=UPI003D0569E3
MGTIINIPAVNILIVDDHPLVSEGLKSLLVTMLPETSIINTADTVDKAKKDLEIQSYQYVLTDLMMPGQKIPPFISYIHSHYPGIIIMIVSSVTDINTVKECLSLGAHGFLSKGVEPHEIKLAFENVYKGRLYISSDLTGKFASGVLATDSTALTKKELEVLRLLAAGHKTKLVAEMLHISSVTVMTHKRNLMQKLNVHSAVELVKYAYDNHLI